MSNPKEKAEELFNRHLISQFIMSRETAKVHSLITVDQIMNQCFDYRDIDLQASYDYWQEVKDELKDL